MNKRAIRRGLVHWTVAATTVLALSGVGASTAGASRLGPKAAAASMVGGDGLPPGNWTPSQRQYLENLIQRTEAALPAFSDPDYLVSIGFHDFGADAPGGYVHYINNAWIDDDHILDPTHPESLLFQQVYDPDTDTSTMVLKAAMFFLPTGTTMKTIPPDLAWIPGWHVHPDICITDDGYFAGLANNNGGCSSGHPMTGPPMTHVWITDNACGNRFSMVDVGGLMCVDDMDMDDHDSMPMPMPNDSMPMDDNKTMQKMPTTKTMPAMAQHAQPVAAQPNYTG